MISPLPGWSWSYGIDGALLVSRQGSAAGNIRYTERNRPVLPVRDLIGARLDADFEPSGPLAVETIVTEEGEHGALVFVDGKIAGAPARRAFGVVFGDDFYALVDGISLRTESFETLTAAVRQLTLTDAHLLGVRRRRYTFTPPAGWHEESLLFYTRYTAPDSPTTQMMVCPAMPCPLADIEHMLTAGVQGLSLRLVGMRQRLVIGCGLSGHRLELVSPAGADGKAALRRLVLLADSRYIFPAFIDATGELARRDREAFDALVASIQPIPAGTPRRPATHVEVLADQWAE